MTGYIYLIVNKVNGKQYIGQTTQSIEKRFKRHIYDAKGNYTNMYLHKAMRKYGEDNFLIWQIDLIEHNEKHELMTNLNTLEKYYIAEYNTLSPYGYNLTKGGEQRSENAKVPVDEYDLYGNFVRTHNSLKDAAHSVGTEYNTAIFKCCNGISKFAFQRIWRYHNDPLDKYLLVEDMQKASRDHKMTPVDKYQADGTYICSYDSIIEAAKEFEDSISISHISECCKGKLYTAYGFVWRYKNDTFDKYLDKDKRFTKCEVYTSNDVYIGIFDSILSACNYLKIDYKKSNSHISQCCKGKRKTCHGYKWKYA